MEEATEQQLPHMELRRGKGENVAKRKLVQSVLFSHSEKYEENKVRDKDEKDEDWSNSSNKRQKKTPKRKTKSNSKAVSQSRALKKVIFLFCLSFFIFRSYISFYSMN